jgi:hypothetical protein
MKMNYINYHFARGIQTKSRFYFKFKRLYYHDRTWVPKSWGLGTSSTLINNIAQWLQIDAFTLLKTVLAVAVMTSPARKMTLLLYTIWIKAFLLLNKLLLTLHLQIIYTLYT